MIATVMTRAMLGTDAPEVRVEAHLSNGLPHTSIVGLLDGRETRERVRSALTASKFHFPAGRITINLAPADLPKQGARYDLPIALGILAASGQIPRNDALIGSEYYGELSLSGAVKPISGVITAVCGSTRARRTAVVPKENLPEACAVPRSSAAGVAHLLEVCAHVRGSATLHFQSWRANTSPPISCYPDLRDVRGQSQARRALEIAAAGNHSILLIGPPGSGKSMLAHRLPGLLPPLSSSEAVEVAAIASLSTRKYHLADWAQRPFRTPHHTASVAALTGGGSPPTPGEISLAHHGVLFLDELAEFNRRVLETLREPLETGTICLSRGTHRAEFPARFQLIAAMNPCPCGFCYGDSSRPRCSPDALRRYRSRVSGPLLDRFDLRICLSQVPLAFLNHPTSSQETSAEVSRRVELARRRQLHRQRHCNASLSNADTELYCRLDSESQARRDQVLRNVDLSARAYHRILRVARTIADLEGCGTLRASHLEEAVSLHRLVWLP